MKVLLANENLDVSLAREEETKVASQKKTDELEINSKSKWRDIGKGTAKALEKEQGLSKKKAKR